MDELVSALATTQYSFALYAWDRAPSGDYGVISMQESSDFLADNKHGESGTSFYVDYFTRDASETVKTTIEAALSAFPFALRSVQFESDTKYIHYEWVVGIYG